MSKWKILHGAGDVAVYNGLKEIFHVFPEEAKIVCDILNRLEDEVERLKGELEKTNQDRLEWMDEYNSLNATIEALQSDLDRCKSERLELISALDNLCKANPNDSTWNYPAAFDKAQQLLTAFRSQTDKTNAR